MRRPAALFALALALAGCTDTQDPTIEAGGDPSAPETSNPTFTGAPIAPPISAPAVDPRAYLIAVRASATEGGGSRVVFEFEPLVPGYTIDFVERPITEDGSGDEVEVDGEAVLSVRMENTAGARIEGERVIPTYSGPDRVPATGDPAVVTEVVDTGDFEGVVTWVVGLRAKVPAISVSTFAEPHRLVIDVPAPTGG